MNKFEINWSSYFISAKPSQEDTFLDVLILSGAARIFKNRRILSGKFGKCGAAKRFLRTWQVPDVPSRSGRPSMAPVAVLALCPGLLTLQAPQYRHTGRKWTLHKRGLSHFRKVGYFFPVLLPKQELAEFSAMRNSLFPVLFKALKETLSCLQSPCQGFPLYAQPAAKPTFSPATAGRVGSHISGS